MIELLSLSGILGVGLSAGLFFTYSNSVLPGLAKVASHEFVAVMTSINREILNARFFLVFVGALIAPAMASIVAFAQGGLHERGLSSSLPSRT